MQTFFLRAGDGPWTEGGLAGFAAADTVIHLSRDIAAAKIYPCLDPRTSHARLLEGPAPGARHREIAGRAREALVALWSGGSDERARRLANYLTQPFFCAEPWTRHPGSHVGLAEALDDCAGILDGRHDDCRSTPSTSAAACASSGRAEHRPETRCHLARETFEARIGVVGVRPGGTAQVTMSVSPYSRMKEAQLLHAVLDVATTPGCGMRSASAMPWTPPWPPASSRKRW